MVRLLYTLGVCAMLIAGGVARLCVNQWHRDGSEPDRLAEHLAIVEVFRLRYGGQRTEDSAQTASPLVVQAEAFAVYLNPPVVAAEEESGSPVVPLTSHGLQASAPAVRPASVSADFRVVAVSCCPERPERSMALLCAASDSEGEAKWVKEGAGIGHFVVHEIKQGAVVLRNGEQQCELAVERSRLRRTLVRGVLAGTQQVSAAMPDSNSIVETHNP
ncbi:MAG: hypothetical protein JW993_01830 [Sedimentisphaerales bacterium]|nr:hypothetical protein [Sedimentisphaerales bacterium]